MSLLSGWSSTGLAESEKLCHRNDAHFQKFKRFEIPLCKMARTLNFKSRHLSSSE